MKTDSFFYRFFSIFPDAFFMLIGESKRKANQYQFTSVEVKELAFRFDGIFSPNSQTEPIRFVEVQFKKETTFYSRLFGEIFLYLRQYQPANNWRAVVIFPAKQADPGVHHHYQEFFENNRLQRIYLNALPDGLLDRFPLNLLKIIIAREEEVADITEKIVSQIPDAIPNLKQQEIIFELVVNLLLQKFKKITREEVQKMIEPLISDIKKTRFYQEIAEEGREQGMEQGMVEEKREIAKALFKKQMSVQFIVEVTGLSKDEVLEIDKHIVQTA